jgi:hypothetical protein
MTPSGGWPGEAEGSFDDLDRDLLGEAQARLGQLAGLGVGFAHSGCSTSGGIPPLGGRSCMTAWRSSVTATGTRPWTAWPTS